MKEQLWKYPITNFHLAPTELEIPKGGEVLAVQNQFEVPTIWVKVNPDNEKEKRKFQIYGTGHPLDENIDYIGTFQEDNGQLIWHLFVFCCN
jgi:hypothetical protein